MITLTINLENLTYMNYIHNIIYSFYLLLLLLPLYFNLRKERVALTILQSNIVQRSLSVLLFSTYYLSLCRWHTLANIFWVMASQRKVLFGWFIYSLFISLCNIPRMQWIECQVSGKINNGFGIVAAIQLSLMILGRNDKHTWSLIHIGDLFHVHCLLIELTSVFCNLFMRYSRLLEPFHKQFVRKVQLMHASRVLVGVRLTRFLGPL